MAGYSMGASTAFLAHRQPARHSGPAQRHGAVAATNVGEVLAGARVESRAFLSTAPEPDSVQ